MTVAKTPLPPPKPADPLDLIGQLELERIELNLFRAWGPQDHGGHFFGGHVIAQALMAAYETVPTRVCHSLHAYFIRPGRTDIPVLYEVDRARDGGTFTTRRVIAIQNGEQIFNLAASFQEPSEGLDHQFEAPAAPGPETIKEEPNWRGTVRPIDIRWPDPRDPSDTRKRPPHKQVWMRAKAAIGEDFRLHQALLAYASDMAFMETALRVHGITWQTQGLQSASLDHAMWFHRPANFNDWVLFDQDSPSTSQGRGLVRGGMYSKEGALVASVAQECLMRIRPPKP